MTETSIGPAGGYVRHRDRMVQESVFQDLRDTLIACGWLAGTTTNLVQDPGTGEWGTATVEPGQELALLEGQPVILLDYFPDLSNKTDAVGDESNATELNTFAVSAGAPGEAAPLELGSNAELQPYTFSMAFYAVSDAAALALFSDLRDRYAGRIVRSDVVALYDYNATTPRWVVDMDVERFQYQVNTEISAPHEVHLYFAELVITDLIDAR